MKRSFVNAVIRDGMEFFQEHRFLLPPFAYFSPDDWRSRTADASEIFDLKLGWDVTTFGSGDFEHTGLLLFTLRNGLGKTYPKPYAEKIMIVREGQITPRHFHWHKREDIINRGGGNLVIELFRADPVHNCLDNGEFIISVNGMRKVMKSADKLILHPGNSVCLEPIHAHCFYGEPGAGTVLVGEVSMVNDDSADNCFVDGVPRFDPIEEDEPIAFLLASDYKNMRLV
ncbi:MAG: D-lyxose/D-mannose family sugar isomerase [Victivallales bacterium]|jgi:D-lyxose ketol-isomerase|nr:D-lyxose/D-mannose family sugar isomerase [Victivallales bacterium]